MLNSRMKNLQTEIKTILETHYFEIHLYDLASQ